MQLGVDGCSELDGTGHGTETIMRLTNRFLQHVRGSLPGVAVREFHIEVNLVSWKRTGSDRLAVMASTSIAVHPAMATSSSSTGVNSPAFFFPKDSVPPREFVAS